MDTAEPLITDREEELARADWYGTLATLFSAPPSQQLLDRIGAANPGGDGALGDAWRGLASAARKTTAEAVRDEYERLFVGVGKPEVMLYGSYYLSGFLMEKPLVALRTDLVVLGLQRGAGVVESEDHIASLCDVMRHLIVSSMSLDGTLESSLAVQKNFFSNHLQPWVRVLWETLEQRSDAAFYVPVGQVARCFFEIEMQAFDLFA